jgi:hypothetical protein
MISFGYFFKKNALLENIYTNSIHILILFRLGMYIKTCSIDLSWSIIVNLDQLWLINIVMLN